MRSDLALLCVAALLASVAAAMPPLPSNSAALASSSSSAIEFVPRPSSWRGVPAGWEPLEDAAVDEDSPLHVVVAVKQRNTRLLEERLLQVSDPESALYSQHMTQDEVSRLLAPAPASLAAVVHWFQRFGVDADQLTFSDNGDFVRADLPVATAEKMLQVRYVRYRHADSGVEVVRADRAYSVPAFALAHVDFVSPAGGFPATTAVRVRRSRAMVEGPNQLGGLITPAVLRTLYGVGNYTANSANVQACASFLGQFYAPADLQTFFQQFDTEAVGRAPYLYGPNDQTNPGVEASLDIEYIMAMGNNVTTQFWSTPGVQPHNPENEPFLVWLLNVSALTDASIPKTISVSYGDNENSVDFDYAVRVNVEFQKLGVRGVSIMFSSGDGGVAGSQTSFCPNNVFIPTFPAASPWVTAVGGTAQSNPEVAASFSSGGFSNYWAIPDFQAAAVQAYLASNTSLPPANVYNSTGAGFPDVSAQSESFNVVQGGSVVPFGVDGTSCSSPTFTGIVSLLNDARIAAGKKSLGFLNPLIYKNPQLFNDVTSGSNPGCNSNGFSAAPGWDPVTGMGTPNFPALMAYVMSLP